MEIEFPYNKPNGVHNVLTNDLHTLLGEENISQK